MTKQINFKKVFTIFFVALGLFAVIGVFMGAWGSVADSRLLERLMLTGLRERLFTEPLVVFRNIGYLFLIAFNALLALWVYTDCQKRESKKGIWSAFTLIAGLIGWLAYLIIRKEDVQIDARRENI